MGQGVKRKLDDLELDKTVCQRQSILNISVGKLQVRSMKRVEPPLLRSVLILNTLKHIETELLREGVQSPTNTSAFTIPEVDPNSTIIDFHPEQQQSPKGAEDAGDQTGPLPSIDTFVGARVTTEENIKMSTELSTFASLTEASLATIYQSPLRMEEVLSELDFTMCDYDMFSAVSGANKLTPLSAEEVLHSCPNSSSNFNETYTTLTNATLSPFCKSETAFDDLDNIMQILVGS